MCCVLSLATKESICDYNRYSINKIFHQEKKLFLHRLCENIAVLNFSFKTWIDMFISSAKIA